MYLRCDWINTTSGSMNMYTPYVFGHPELDIKTAIYYG